jgi:hypothetical protein
MTYNLSYSSQYIWNREDLTRHIEVMMRRVMGDGKDLKAVPMT